MTALIKKKISGKIYWYAVKSARVDGKPKIVWQRYLGTADHIVDVFERGLDVTLKSYDFGGIAALLSVAEELGFKDIVTNATGDPEAWKHLLLMISGRFTKPRSKNKITGWYKETFLPMGWQGFKPYEQEMLRKMDLLTDDAIDDISLGLSKALLDKGLKPELLILDPTNFFTCIEEGEELPQKGKSKEMRNDKNLVSLALAVTQDNIPFYHQTYEGGKHDARVFPELLDGIIEYLERLDIDTDELALVFDKGNNSEPNITKALEKVHVIGSAKRSQVKELYQVPLKEYAKLYTSGSGVDILGYRAGAELFGGEFTVVISYNPSTHKKQKKQYEEKKEKIVKALDEIKKRMTRKGRGRKLTLEGAMRQALDAIPRDYRGIFKPEIKEGAFDYRVDEAKEKELYQGFGKQAIFTDLHEWTAEKIVKGYNSKHLVEDDFKLMKGALIVPVKPIYHWKDKRIKAHIFLCFLGVLFFRYMLHKVGELGMSAQRVAEELQKMRVGLVRVKGTKKAKIVVEQMSLEQANLFATLKLNRFVPS
jgi:transposase